jgi:hypothetical protein
MHASVVTVQFKPDQIDKAIQIYEESQPSHTQKAAGAKGFLLLVDRTNGKALSIGLWESKEAADKFDTRVLHGDFGAVHRDEVVHDELATAFPAGDTTGALPPYSIVASFAGVFEGQPHKATYEVGATAGHMDVLQKESAGS